MSCGATRRALLPLLGLGSGCVADPFDLSEDTIPWLVARSEHFVYHADVRDPDAYLLNNPMELPDGAVFDPAGRDVSETIGVYLDAYEVWYAGLAALFEVEPDAPIDVYVYSSQAQRLRVGQLSAGGAIDTQRASGGGLAIHTATGVHAHELVHVFQSLNADAPMVWMEGMAVALGDGFVEVVDDGPYFNRSQRPNLPLPGVEGHGLPYVEVWTAQGLVFTPVHRTAALTLGLPDPAFEALEPYPDLRPSMLSAPGSTATRDLGLQYVMGGSLVHYLVLTYGWDPFLEALGRLSSTALAGELQSAVFRDVYGVELTELEEAWVAWLGTRPAAFWDAPVTLVPGTEP
ncbi:MAG: hypothetical protein H6739_31025 [Alphaproteobacteria bacterium]|nr:hypothetical protein [Alphaproteobacteria bacterium]